MNRGRESKLQILYDRSCKLFRGEEDTERSDLKLPTEATLCPPHSSLILSGIDDWERCKEDEEQKATEDKPPHHRRWGRHVGWWGNPAIVPH
jgi:hypothetical protein